MVEPIIEHDVRKGPAVADGVPSATREIYVEKCVVVAIYYFLETDFFVGVINVQLMTPD